jgi:CheY-like chemotaxis protein
MMKRILVIDDSKFHHRQVNRLLNEEEFEILHADNGRVGLAMLHEHQPDCVLADLIMPDMDGFQLLEAAQDAGLSVPIIISTADIQVTTHERCMKLGAFSIINKPLEARALIEALQAALSVSGVS